MSTVVRPVRRRLRAKFEKCFRSEGTTHVVVFLPGHEVEAIRCPGFRKTLNPSPAGSIEWNVRTNRTLDYGLRNSFPAVNNDVDPASNLLQQFL